MANKSVEAPKGFHWMKSGKGYKLMKDPTDGYKAHKGASKKASFQVQAEQSKTNCKRRDQSWQKEICCLCYGW